MRGVQTGERRDSLREAHTVSHSGGTELTQQGFLCAGERWQGRLRDWQH